MTRDIYYSRACASGAKRAPKITDLDAFKTILSEKHPNVAEHAALGETRETDSYPATVFKTLHGFQFYDNETYVIPGIGFDPNYDNQKFRNFWTPISEHTEPFYFWLRNGNPIPIEFHPNSLDTTQELYRISFANGELTSATEYTIGTIATTDATENTCKND